VPSIAEGAIEEKAIGGVEGCPKPAMTGNKPGNSSSSSCCRPSLNGAEPVWRSGIERCERQRSPHRRPLAACRADPGRPGGQGCSWGRLRSPHREGRAGIGLAKPARAGEIGGSRSLTDFPGPVCDACHRSGPGRIMPCLPVRLVTISNRQLLAAFATARLSCVGSVPARIEMAKRLGADHVVDFRNVDAMS
jgi:hypothetical protein